MAEHETVALETRVRFSPSALLLRKRRFAEFEKFRRQLAKMNFDVYIAYVKQLIKEGLIEYRRPYWWVKDISARRCHGGDKTEDIVSAGRYRT